MLPEKYRWTDYQISPTRLRAELVATLLILMVVGVAGFSAGGREEDHPRSHIASTVSSEQPSNLAAIVKPRIPATHQANAQSHGSAGKC